jgi:hypothetical protein
MATRLSAAIVGEVFGDYARGQDFDGGLGGEAEETALFLPIVRQVSAQPHEPRWR